MFSGAFTAVVTPFRDGRVDETALKELIRFGIDGGMDGFVPCGTTGESPTLSHDEHNRVVELTVKEISGMSDTAGDAYRPVHYISAICTALYMKEAMEWADKNGGVSGVKIRDGMYQKKDWVPKGAEGVCKPSTWTATDHRGSMSVDLYRAVVTGPTNDGSVADLMKAGTIKLEKVATVDLPRKTELQGW